MSAFPQQYQFDGELRPVTDALTSKVTLGNGCLLKLQNIRMKHVTALAANWDIRIYALSEQGDDGRLIASDIDGTGDSDNPAKTGTNATLFDWNGADNVENANNEAISGAHRTILFRYIRVEFDGANEEEVDVTLTALDPDVKMNA